MKKLLLLALCAFATTAQAQNHTSDKSEEYKWGVYGSQVLPRLGVFIERKQTETLGFRGAIMGYLDDLEDSSNSNMYGITIPLTARFYPTENRRVGIPAGIQITVPWNELEFYRPFLLYFATGADYEFPGGFQIGIDLNVRLTKALKNQDVPYGLGGRVSFGYNLAKLY